MSTETVTPYLDRIPMVLEYVGYGLNAVAAVLIAVGILLFIIGVRKGRLKNWKE
tara:strand:+ start:11020 stop:11181 length:162 start_codon:yes stop_codon:yes gene_type:complete